MSIFLLAAACEDSSQARLPPDEVLVDLVYDLHVAEVSLIRVNIARQDSVAGVIRDRIAATHGISPQRMDTWLEMLQKSPERLIVVYDSVIARFERQVPNQ
jgi:hypothetical protein